VTSTGSFFYLYRLLCTVGEEGCSVPVGVAIFARVDMAGGGARLLCFVPILVRSYGLSGILPAEGGDSFCELLGHLKVAIYKYLAVLLHNVFRCVYCYIE